jgi:cell division septation protein DedD
VGGWLAPWGRVIGSALLVALAAGVLVLVVRGVQLRRGNQ